MRHLNSNKFRFTIVLIIFQVFLNLNLSYSQSTDWQQYRGPYANGISSESDWSPEATLDSNAILWETNVGMGFSAPTIKGDKLYIMGNFEKEDSSFYDKVVCLNTTEGKEIWKHEYQCRELEDPGPFSTPLLHDGYLYTLSREGHFFCFNAENGTIIWEHNLMKDGFTNQEDSNFFVASSPVIYKELVLLNLNKNGAAFHKKTGELIWNSEIVQENFNISTPVLFEHNDKMMMAIQTEHQISSVNPLSGKVYWEVDSGSMPDPIILENDMYHFTEGGFKKYQIGDDTPKFVWSNYEVKCQCQSYVVKDNFAYGFGQAKLQCISLETGERKWGKPFREGALILSNNILIIIDQRGSLVFAEANPDEYKEILRMKAIENPKTDDKGRGYRRVSVCLTNPVLSNGKIYIRNSYGNLVCINAETKKH